MSKTRVSAYLPKELSDRLDTIYSIRKKSDRSVSYSDLICESLWIYTSEEVAGMLSKEEITKEQLEKFYSSKFDDYA